MLTKNTGLPVGLKAIDALSVWCALCIWCFASACFISQCRLITDGTSRQVSCRLRISSISLRKSSSQEGCARLLLYMQNCYFMYKIYST